MLNCPSALPGAVTRTTNTESGVDLQITATDRAVSRRIIELAALHEQMGEPSTTVRQHSGKHGGPGDLGRCPVIHTVATVTFTRLRTGVVIHVRAADPADVARVQSIVADRVARLALR